MELHDALARRHMVRAYRADPIDADVLERVLGAAVAAPSAGNTGGFDLIVLEGPEQTARYWDTTLAPERRAGFPWPGLLDAPVLVVVCVDPGAYVERYGEPDKVHTGLGAAGDDWPVPYWFVDGGMAIMALLLAATDAGLGALFFGIFGHEPALAAELGVPAGRRLAGTIALGHPAPDRPSRSGTRGRRDPAAIVHRGTWGGPRANG
jgi:nitroreductase